MIGPLRGGAEEAASRSGSPPQSWRRDGGEEEQRGVQTVILERERKSLECLRLNGKIKDVSWELVVSELVPDERSRFSPAELVVRMVTCCERQP